MGLKYPAIVILNEMFFTYKKAEFIWKDPKIFLRKMFDRELGNELFSSSSSFPNSQNNKLSLPINFFKNTKLQ